MTHSFLTGNLSDCVPEGGGRGDLCVAFEELPGCPWPKALINTKILPPALGLLQKGKSSDSNEETDIIYFAH